MKNEDVSINNEEDKEIGVSQQELNVLLGREIENQNKDNKTEKETTNRREEFVKKIKTPRATTSKKTILTKEEIMFFAKNNCEVEDNEQDLGR